MLLRVNDPAVLYLAFISDQPAEPEGVILFGTEGLTREFTATFVRPDSRGHQVLTDTVER
jgi:hypothetical protein